MFKKSRIDAMLTKIYTKKSNVNWLIKVIWLIITSIVLVSLISSCSSTRSIRNNAKEFSNKDVSSKKNTNNQSEYYSQAENFKNNQSNEIDAIKEFENKIEKSLKKNTVNQESKSQEFASSNESVKLPPLREQMKSLLDEQTIIKENIKSLQNDVSDIKTSLTTLRNDIINLKFKDNNLLAYNNLSYDVYKEDDLNENKVQFNQNTTKVIKANTVNHKKKKIKTIVNKNTNESDKKNITKEKHPKKAESTKHIASNIKQEKVNNGDAFSNAMKEFQKQNFDKSIEILSNLLQTENNENKIIDIHYWLGESYYGIKNYNKAIENFNKVLASKSHSKQSNAQILLGECYIRKGDIAEAKKAFQSFITKYPNSDYIPRAKKMIQQL